MREAHLCRAVLEGVVASDADFTKSRLEFVNLRYLDAVGINLTDTQLSNSDLSGADLRRATVSNAWIVRPIVTQANLADIDFSTATFSTPWVIGADENIKHPWPPESYSSNHFNYSYYGPRFDRATIWPDSVNFPRKRISWMEFFWRGVSLGVVLYFVLVKADVIEHVTGRLFLACAAGVAVTEAWHISRVVTTNQQMQQDPSMFFSSDTKRGGFTN